MKNMTNKQMKRHINLSTEELVQKALENKEGTLTDTKALNVETGAYTGRSPKDRFIVQTNDVINDINWGNENQPISEEVFESLLLKVENYLESKELYILDAVAGADESYQLSVRCINEFAWHNLFAKNLFIDVSAEKLESYSPDFTIISAPNFKANPQMDGTNSEAFVIINFQKKTVLIGGTHYAGEMKKSIFSVMNYKLPKENVLSMHCSANVSTDGDVALFFGLSGTGKTTLSADSSRMLIGDDEHGWGENGVFNIEGGCYAKTIDLRKEKEPEIFNAIKFGTVLENVMVSELGVADYKDATLTENTRAAYPLNYIQNAKIPSVAGQPTTIIFLTADAFGVLPPISKLDKKQAMYFFLNGYTSKLAGTERGITEPQATFSACFGSPFLPLEPKVYAHMLGDLMETHNVDIYLVNTGWSGGGYGVGKRIDLSYTRKMVESALNGHLKTVETKKDVVFGLSIPVSCPGVPSELLQPNQSWSNQADYLKKAVSLKKQFEDNFLTYQ